MDFLHKAQLERTKAENGVDEETKREMDRNMPSNAPSNNPSGMRSQSSPIPGSPPVGGNTQMF